MLQEEQLALWSAAAVLRGDDAEIAALTVEDLASEVREEGDLAAALEAMRRFDQRPGDFGAEIIGPLLVPVLVEAGKAFWSAYLKRLTEEGGKRLADLTLDALKGLARKAWAQDASLARDYAGLIRQEGERQGLSADQIARLVAVAEQPGLDAHLQ